MFLDYFETTLKLLGCLPGMPKISDVFGKEDIFEKSRFLEAFSFVKVIWIILRLGSWSILEHEGPCSEAKTSQFLCSLKCFWHAFLMLSIVTSSYSNGTKSLGPSREYFTVVGFGSVLSLCTNSSIILVSLTLFFHDLKIHKKLIEFEIVLKTFVVFIFCSKILTRYIKIHGPQPPRPSYFFTLILLE